MATEIIVPPLVPLTKASHPIISLPATFQIHSQDGRLKSKSPLPADAQKLPPLGVLSSFDGSFVGNGFNSIFRPNSGAPTGTSFPNPISPLAPTPPNENVLELNLTSETLTFSSPIGSVPNRGLGTQEDILLNGKMYVQVINDITNTDTGLADPALANLPNAGIHFETGLWMHLPATSTDPNFVQAESVVRMGSIPHGTTINAQATVTPQSKKGPPSIPSVDMTPFPIGTNTPLSPNPFLSMTQATNTATARLPQDLTKFIATGSITQAMLNDPNTVLRNAIIDQNITNTTFFTVSTTPTAAEENGAPIPEVQSQDPSNPTASTKAFLQGAAASTNVPFLNGNPIETPTAPLVKGPNASAAQMTASFWIETVQTMLEIPVWTPGQPALLLRPALPHAGALVPTWRVVPPREVVTPRVVEVVYTQIQYSQNVGLNFAGLTWPHVSVNTLIPMGELSVPVGAWN